MDIILKNIFKDYSNSYSQFKLSIPELRIQTGIVTFIMGANGSGKSVLLKIISKEIQNDNKDFVIQNTNNQNKINEKLLRQNATENLALDLTLKENFIIHSEPQRFFEKVFPQFKLKNQINKSLESYGFFKSKANQPVKQLSGGQQQTLAFFVTISTKTSLLLLDEFLAATDLNTTKALLDESQKYAKSNDAAVVIVSHDIDIAYQYANKIVVLSGGALKEEITKDSPNWNKKYINNTLKGLK